ncbi:PQQ-binding-like beta-propeller repeat protein [Rhizobium sp. WYCCWR 11152]|uniref:outer membrane protein assembly factor BamB family protein n=1 Tax=Rhizobium sp. WYCCWR 11152 TaxID=2692316 RepID=UPI0014914ACD|nr:PQQ-binding-like beta-propeller repeat protein [Rhizobium sp. WYCCWR 11152]NNU65107.1 PQQ-binding-like beta-propeller repeat protein [Rhizobium sp. WYCCWR 11152]
MVSLQSLSSIFRTTKQRWATEIGTFHYRNNFIRKGNRLISSTSGSVWNSDDSADGVYCLDITSGEIIWKFNTDGDANGILEYNNVVVGGTDNGQIFALDLETGSLLAQHRSNTPFYGTPLVVQQDLEDVFVSVSYGGEIVLYKPREKLFVNFGLVRGDFRASPATSRALAAIGTFVLASESGELMRVALSESEAHPRFLHVLKDTPPSSGGNYLLRIKGIGSLLISESRIYVSYIRNTYDKHPPLCCIDVDTGEKIWDAKAVKTLSKKRRDYGNARVLPVIFKDLLISTFGYSDSVHAFSLSTGRGEWMLRLDEGLLQNWASPVLSPTGRLFVPRVNGIIHEVDIPKLKVVNSISVEIGRYVSNDGYYVRKRHFGEDRWEGTNPITHESRLDRAGPNPSEILVSGLAATPIVFDDTLIVGGVSGQLRAYSI